MATNWLDCWSNYVNMTKFHSNPGEFINQLCSMERMPKDISDTKKEASKEAIAKMNEFLDMTKFYGVNKLIIHDIKLANVSMIIDSYEAGSGWKNIPDKEFHVINELTLRPVDKTGSPYVGYGWYLKHIKEIKIDDIINMDHIMDNLNGQDIMKIYVIFSERKSTQCRPCSPPTPTYIGFCTSIF